MKLEEKLVLRNALNLEPYCVLQLLEFERDSLRWFLQRSSFGFPLPPQATNQRAMSRYFSMFCGDTLLQSSETSSVLRPVGECTDAVTRRLRAASSRLMRTSVTPRVSQNASRSSLLPLCHSS